MAIIIIPLIIQETSHHLHSSVEKRVDKSCTKKVLEMRKPIEGAVARPVPPLEIKQ